MSDSPGDERAALTRDRREPDNGYLGLVSTVLSARIFTRLRRGEPVTIEEMTDATTRMQHQLTRKQKRIQERNAELAA